MNYSKNLREERKTSKANKNKIFDDICENAVLLSLVLAIHKKVDFYVSVFLLLKPLELESIAIFFRYHCCLQNVKNIKCKKTRQEISCYRIQ